MTIELISQGELGDIKDRELKCFQEEKAWTGKEIYSCLLYTSDAADE